MNVKVRIQRGLVEQMRADLSRRHPFAAERVGFLYGRLAAAGADSALVLMTHYVPLADDRYINDPHSGARIDSQAIRGAMQGVLDKDQGAFHVHMHPWPGQPALSHMDAAEIPQIVTGLRRAGPSHAHGIFLMHDERCAAWVWLPGQDASSLAQSVCVVGFPLQLFADSDHG